MDIFVATLEQMLIMLFFVIVGWVLGKLKMLPEGTGKTLSVLQVNVFMPAMLIGNLSANFTVASLGEKAMALVVSVPMLFITVLMSLGLSRLFAARWNERNMYTYIFAFTNFGYLGYPVVKAVFGDEALSDLIVFAIPFSIGIYTYGMNLFKKEQGGSLIKKLLIPTNIALALGILFGLLNVHLPKTVTTALDMASGCVGINAMLLTGFILSGSQFLKLFGYPKAYYTAALRLVLIPAVIGTILYLFGVRGSILVSAVCVAAMPVGMNVIVFSEANGLDSKRAAQLCMIASLLSVLTIPIVFAILSKIA